jgi:hypothetical protein
VLTSPTPNAQTDADKYPITYRYAGADEYPITYRYAGADKYPFTYRYADTYPTGGIPAAKGKVPHLEITMDRELWGASDIARGRDP